MRIFISLSLQNSHFFVHVYMPGIYLTNKIANSVTLMLYLCKHLSTYFAEYPPSTGTLAPVIYADASDAKNTMAPFISV